MQVRLRRLPILFTVILLLSHLFLEPLSIVYAQTENEILEQSSTEEDSDGKQDLDNSKVFESKEPDHIENREYDELLHQEATEKIESPDYQVEVEDQLTEAINNNDQELSEQEIPTSEEIRFSMDVGEYLEVQKNKQFSIEVSTNQVIDSLRMVVPKGTDFSFTDEKNRTHIQTNNDESSLWLITFNHESDRFPATVSVSDSGQISVEDKNGEIHSAFLYVNTGVSKRNTQILSESTARTTVTVSSWANFRTAWNNNNRTVIDATSDIPAGTTALNNRTSNVTIRSSTATSNSPRTINTTGATLSWSGATITIDSPVRLNTGAISGTNLEIFGVSRVIVNRSSSLQNLSINNAITPWPQLTNNGSLSINQNLSINSSWIMTDTTINVGGTVTLNNMFLIHSNSLGVLPIQTSNMVKNIANTGFAIWEDVRFNFTTPATRFWSNLTFTLSGNSITQSSQPTFNDSTFKLTNNVTAISSRNFSGGGGSVVMPPVPEEEAESAVYTLSLEATPIEGGIPESELYTIAEEESTKITANPNEGYDFIQWEIVSGTGSNLEDETSPETTFTMGSEDAVVRAVYEEEDKDLEPVNPVDPLDPEVEVDPENKPELPKDQGQLSIDFVSSFDFGSQAISVQDQIYYAKPQRLLNEDGTVNETKERPNYVQISDRRSENERNGWALAVTQKEQFKGAENQVLNGASLILSNQQVITAQGGTAPGLQSVPCTLVPGNRRTLLHAQGSEGTGTWIYRFGDGDKAGESIALDVPRGANPETTTYSSTLIWELSAVPGN